MALAVAAVLVGVSVCVAVELSLDPDAEVPEQFYRDDLSDKKTDEDTMEYLDNLKEDLDCSIVPLSEMSRELSRSAQPVTKKPRRRRGTGKVGRPKKYTAVPAINQTKVMRTRMKWDEKMNKFIMYTYYYVTKLETDKKDFRLRLREKFLEAYPEWVGITEQRLMDQRRSILSNRHFDQETIKELKMAARRQLADEGVVIGSEAIASEESL